MHIYTVRYNTDTHEFYIHRENTHMHTHTLYSATAIRIHTEPLLISIATPDFSMPYNVICFVCTVIAIGFGSIFNLTTRKLVPDTEENKTGILSKLLGLLKRGSKKEQDNSVPTEQLNTEQLSTEQPEK